MNSLESGYNLKRFYLTTAQINTKMALAGEIIQIIQSSAPSATIKVRLNNNSAPQINLKMHDTIALPFERFWLQWEAQSGHWVDILISDSLQKRFHFADAVAHYSGKPSLKTPISVTTSLSAVISPTKECSEFVLCNMDNSGDPIYIGDATLDPAGGNAGDIILPTERRVFKGVGTDFQIYARCRSGSGTLGVIEYD